MLDALFRSGHAADLALLALAAEAAWLARRGRLRALLPTLLSGAAFALALRAALTGAAWPLVALPLAAAGLLHAWDVARR